jgi:hypothetical protein
MPTEADAAAKERTMKKHDPLVVIYREGNRERFRWMKHPEELDSLIGATVLADRYTETGNWAKVIRSSSLRHGLPDAWDANDSPANYEFRDGWLCRVER